jgi:hypothetical protein
VVVDTLLTTIGNQTVHAGWYIRLSTILFCILLAASATYGVPCAQVKSQPDAWVTEKVDAFIRAAHAAYKTDRAVPAYERVLDTITTTIQQCKLHEYASFMNRYRVFVEYKETVSLDRQPDHDLGFLVPDEEYFAETHKYVQIPSFLMDQGFLRSVSRYETLGRAKSFLQQLNLSRAPSEQLIFFSYKSRHLGTPDNKKSRGRLLIVVPGDEDKGLPDKWVQFGVPDPGTSARVRNVSVVSTTVNADGTFNAYFKDFYRTYRRNDSIRISGRWELGEGDDNCVQCHKSGVLPIFPVRGSVKPEEQQAVLAVNELFRTYGSPRFGKYLDERRLGPGLSSASIANRRQRFGAGFDRTVAGSAMICTACHQHEGLGALNWPMDRIVISSFVKGGQMPLGSKLTSPERRDLYAKLVQEYFAIDKDNPGILKSWLLARVPKERQ